VRSPPLLHEAPDELRNLIRCSICAGWHLTKKVDAPKIANRHDDLVRCAANPFAARERIRLAAARRSVDDAYQIRLVA
jgi:hypothetical protein